MTNDGREVWNDLITAERAAKGDLRLTHHTNSFDGQTYITHAEPASTPLVSAFVREEALYPEAETHAARFLDMRRAFLAPSGHGFNRLYFSAEEWNGKGGGSLEEDYEMIQRFIGRGNESLVLLAAESRTTADRLSQIPRCYLAMLGEFRSAFRALHDAFQELDEERRKEKKTLAPYHELR